MIVGLFIGANLGFLAGCWFASKVQRRQAFEDAQKRGRLP